MRSGGHRPGPASREPSVADQLRRTLRQPLQLLPPGSEVGRSCVRVERRLIRPRFDKGEVRRIGKILEEIVLDASVFRTGGFEVSDQHLADRFDVLWLRCDVRDEVYARGHRRIIRRANPQARLA
jgi:hypothetical protein